MERGMRGRILGVLAALAVLAGPAAAETLGEVLRARGATPAPRLPHLDRPLEAVPVLDDERALLVVHVARMRSVYSDAWCRAHHHPCDPDLFDEHVSGDVRADARGDTLAFVTAWDNTARWSDAERWGKLEAFRELRAALGRWDGRGTPPADLYRGLAAGLARARNVYAESPRPGDPRTWDALGRAVAVPDEFTEVVHVYSGLRRADAVQRRERRRRDFEARFGAGAPGLALEPTVVREIFRAHGP
jgi:hypothetical protein